MNALLTLLSRRVTSLLLVLIAPALQAQDDSVALSALLAGTSTLQASFDQRVESADGQLLDESAGMIYLSKPSQLRWDVTEPLEQQIVVDGETYYQYDRDLDQLVIDQLDQQLSALPQILLSGEQDTIDQHYAVRALAASDTGQAFELRPLATEGLFQRLLLGFEAGTLRSLKVEDDLQQMTHFEFSNIRLNEAISPSVFRIEPTAGTDIIRN